MSVLSPISVHTFRVDVTPPVGMYLCGGLHDKSLGVETPLYLRGLVLSSDEDCYVVAVIDYCYLVGRSHRRLVEALANGAGVAPECVVVQSNHVHDAPLIDEEAHAIIAEFAPDLQLHDETYFSDVLKRAEDAVREAVEAHPVPVTGVGFSSHPVFEFASSRRVLDIEGKCHIRWSVCRDLWTRDQPEGLVDPLLDQILLYNQPDRAVACMSFYANHPQVSDGRRLASSDTIGVALDLFEYAQPDVFAMHFDGCGGDVTAGKYSTPQRKRNRLVFGVRLYDAMQAAYDKARPGPADGLTWADWTHEVPLAPVAEAEEQLVHTIRHEEWRSRKLSAATRLLRLRNGINTYPFRVTRLTLGQATVLFLPTELCIEYQLYAKSRHRGPLAVAAYGDSFIKYLATDEAFDQGGYEVDPHWTEIGKGTEGIVKGYLDRALVGK